MSPVTSEKGNPEVDYNVSQHNEQSEFAQLFVLLKPNTPPKRKVELIEELRHRWDPYPGAIVSVKNFEQGPPIVAPVEVKLFGDNLDTLHALATRVETMLKQVEGTIYTNNPIANLKTDLKVEINKEKAQLAGVAPVTIDKSVRMAVAGLEVGAMKDWKGNNYPILVTKVKKGDATIDVFNNLYVQSMAGMSKPLTQLARVKFESSPVVINREDEVRTCFRYGVRAERIFERQGH